MKALLVDLRQFSILLFVALCLILLDARGAFSLPKRLMQNLSSPIQYGLYKSSLIVSKQFEFIVKARTSAKEKQALNEQMAQILSENANLRRKLAETQAFISQSQALNPQTFTLLPARPIGFSRYLKIDKGADSGLKVGQPVVYKENLLGEIKIVTPKQAEIQIITDPASKVAVFVSNGNGKARGILSGEFGSEMLMDKILHGESIAEKDLVYSEGTEGRYPRGLILGQVVKVIERQNEVFKQAAVKPVFNIGDLDLVFVITD